MSLPSRGLAPLGRGGRTDRNTQGQVDARTSLPARGVFGEVTNLPSRNTTGGYNQGGFQGAGYTQGGGRMDQSFGGQSGFHNGNSMGDSRYGQTGFSYQGDKENYDANKIESKKNLTGGLIHLSVAVGDKIAEDYIKNDQEDEFTNYFDKKKGKDIGTFVEILKTGEFKPARGKLEKFVEAKKENLELTLLKNIFAIERHLIKFFLWIQGLVSGICLLHLYLVFSSSDEQNLLETNSTIASTISQVLNVLTMFSLVGMMVMAGRERLKAYYDPSPENTRRKFIALFSLLFFTIVYLCTLVNIPFINNWNFNNQRYPGWYSDQNGEDYQFVYTTSFADGLTVWKYISMGRGVAAVLGWFCLTILVDWDDYDQFRLRQYFGYDP